MTPTQIRSSLLAAAACCVLSAAQALAADAPRAALFVQNRAGADCDSKLAAFSDTIAGDLSQAGFAVVRPEDTLDRNAASPTDSAYPASLHRAVELLQSAKTEGAVDTSPTDAASALNIARALDADCLVMASIVSVGENEVRTQAYGVPVSTRTRVLRIALRVLDGRDGSQLYGDRVVITDRIADTAFQQTAAYDQLDMMLDQGSREIASRVQSAVSAGTFDPSALAGTAAAAAAGDIEITVNSTPAANVELDGIVIGTAPGTYRIAPGVHRLRVSADGYAAWENSVKLRDGQTLDIALELSGSGLERRGERMGQDLADDVAREQSQAQAALAHGQAAAASNSYMRLEGSPQVLTVGTPSAPAAAPATVIPAVVVETTPDNQ